MAIHFDDTNLRAHMLGNAHGETRAGLGAAVPKAFAAAGEIRKPNELKTVGSPNLAGGGALDREMFAFAVDGLQRPHCRAIDFEAEEARRQG